MIEKLLLWNRHTRRVLMALSYGMSDKLVMEKWPIAGYFVRAARKRRCITCLRFGRPGPGMECMKCGYTS